MDGINRAVDTTSNAGRANMPYPFNFGMMTTIEINRNLLFILVLVSEGMRCVY